MKTTVYITRNSNGSLISRGLQNVFIWFHEPCLCLYDANNDLFNLEFADIKKELKGILYEQQSTYNFLYRSENNINSEFGDKIIRNDDGIDIPEILINYVNDRKLNFNHEVFGSGRKSGFRPINVGDMFGYDSEEADYIWSLVTKEFSDIPFREWDKYEKEIPWWNFCKKIELEIKINK